MSRFRSVAFASLLVSPLLSVPAILYGIYHRYKGFLFLWALFMGIVAYLLAPTGDLARNTRNYYLYQGMSCQTFLDSLEHGDFLIQSLSYGFAQIGIPYDFVRLILATAGVYMLLLVFDYQTSHSKRLYSNKEYWLRLWIMMLSFDFIFMVHGVRFGFAICVLVYSMHCYLNLHKTLPALIWGSVTISVHFSMLFILPFILLLMRLKMSKIRLVAIIILTLLVSHFVVSQFSEFLSSSDSYGAGYIGEGKWGTGFEYTYRGQIYRYLRLAVAIPYFYLLLKYPHSGGKWSSAMLALVILFAATYSLTTISDRVIWTFYSCGIFYMLHLENNGVRLGRRALHVVFTCALLFSISNIYARRGIISESKYYKLLFPVPMALSDHYSEAWVLNKIREEYAEQ